jgi:hypothetical protein
MIQVTYLSSATHPMSTDDLLGLLRKCQVKNSARAVTGMLLYGNDTFLQTLEGQDDTVDGLYAKIRDDERHTNVKLLLRKPIEHRHYADWSMGFQRISDRELQNIDGLKDFSAKDFTSAYIEENASVREALMDHFSTWDPLVRQLDEKEQLIKGLKKTLTHIRGCVGIASMVLESVTEAPEASGLSENHRQLCTMVLETLRKV